MSVDQQDKGMSVFDNLDAGFHRAHELTSSPGLSGFISMARSSPSISRPCSVDSKLSSTQVSSNVTMVASTPDEARPPDYRNLSRVYIRADDENMSGKPSRRSTEKDQPPLYSEKPPQDHNKLRGPMEYLKGGGVKLPLACDTRHVTGLPRRTATPSRVQLYPLIPTRHITIGSNHRVCSATEALYSRSSLGAQVISSGTPAGTGSAAGSVQTRIPPAGKRTRRSMARGTTRSHVVCHPHLASQLPQPGPAPTRPLPPRPTVADNGTNGRRLKTEFSESGSLWCDKSEELRIRDGQVPHHSYRRVHDGRVNTRSESQLCGEDPPLSPRELQTKRKVREEKVRTRKIQDIQAMRERRVAQGQRDEAHLSSRASSPTVVNDSKTLIPKGLFGLKTSEAKEASLIKTTSSSMMRALKKRSTEVGDSTAIGGVVGPASPLHLGSPNEDRQVKATRLEDTDGSGSSSSTSASSSSSSSSSTVTTTSWTKENQMEARIKAVERKNAELEEVLEVLLQRGR